MSTLHADAEIELEAIVADVQDGYLPLDTVVDELLEEELAGDDERRITVLSRALVRLDRVVCTT